MTTETMAIQPKRPAKPGFATADSLHLAAAPIFAVMALMTGFFGGDAIDGMCGAMAQASPLDSMAAMYLLMAAFHLAPWLKLISRIRSKH
jgi:hypothetical protein